MNDYFYDKLSDNVKKYIKTDSKWCNEEISNTDNYTKCNKYGKKKAVGLLSVADINNSKDKDGNSSLLGQQSFLLGNQKDKKEIKVIPIENKVKTENKNIVSGVRPTMNLKSNIVISKGNGSDLSPYIIKGTSTRVKAGSKVSDLKIGEYVNYSGFNWRVSNKKDNGNIQLVLDGTITSNESYLLLGFGIDEKYYSTNNKTNLGYKLVNESSKYINTKLLQKQKFKVYNYKGNATYNSDVNYNNYTTKLIEVSMFELFSTSSSDNYWFRESDGKGNAYANSPIGDVVKYEIVENNNSMIKLSVLVDGTSTIKLGSGSKNDPYTITK